MAKITKTVLTSQQYADLRGITQRAVQKSVKLYKTEKEISSRALPGVESIDYFGQIAQLVMVEDYKKVISEFKRAKTKKARIRQKQKK